MSSLSDNVCHEKSSYIEAGQPIITIYGYRNIEDIRIGDMVYTHKGRYRNVVRTDVKSYRGKMYSFNINGFCIPLKVTEDCPIYISGAGKGRDVESFEWALAKDIKIGDSAIFNCGNDLEEDEDDYTNIEKAKILGNFMMYGYIGREDTISFNTENSDGIEQSIKESISILGMEMEEYVFNSLRYISTRNDELFELLKSFGNKGERFIPEGIINSSMRYLREFIKPFALSNKEKKSNMFFRSSSSDRLFMGYQRILIKLNSFPNVYNCLSRNKEFEYFAMAMNRSELDRLGKSMDVTWFKKHNHTSLKIDGISVKDFKGTVHGIEVEEDNSFCNHLFTINDKYNPNR